MRNLFTISLLESLSDPEITRLGKYLQSPFFTNKQYLHALFLLLRRIGQRAAGNPAKYFAKIFPDEPFDAHKWNKALSDLNACIKDFLVVNHLQANQNLYGQALVSACSERFNEHTIQRAVTTVLSPPPARAAPELMDDWHLRFWGRKRMLTHPLTNRTKLEATTLDALEQDLDTYYFISKTQLMCNRVAGIKVYNWPNTQGAPQHWLETIRAVAPNLASPLLKVYCDLLALLLNAGVDLPVFFSTLQQHAPSLHPDELRTIVRMAFNDCIFRQRNGDREAFHWYLTIYNWSNKQNLWATPKAEELYLNIGVLLAKANMKQAFDAHLSAGQEAIPDDRRGLAKDLLKACWAFSRGKYADAQEQLVRISSRHPRYALLRHSIAVRNAYMLFRNGELDSDTVKAALDSFGDFLRNQKTFSDSLCLSYKNLIWFIRQLTQAEPYRDLSKIQLLEEFTVRQPAAREWVEQVLNGLPD